MSVSQLSRRLEGSNEGEGGSFIFHGETLSDFVEKWIFPLHGTYESSGGVSARLPYRSNVASFMKIFNKHSEEFQSSSVQQQASSSLWLTWAETGYLVQYWAFSYFFLEISRSQYICTWKYHWYYDPFANRSTLGIFLITFDSNKIDTCVFAFERRYEDASTGKKLNCSRHWPIRWNFTRDFQHELPTGHHVQLRLGSHLLDREPFSPSNASAVVTSLR